MKTPLKPKIICSLQSLQRERKMKKQLRKNKNKIGHKKPTKTGRKSWWIKRCKCRRLCDCNTFKEVILTISDGG